LLRWTQFLFLVAAGIIALTLFTTRGILGESAGSVVFWRVLTWLRALRSRQ
jgi:hypothetical protein